MTIILKLKSPMNMFGIVDHLSGAVLIRIRRKSYSLLGKADTSFIDTKLAFGGSCKPQVLAKDGFNCILDMRQEGKHDEKLISKLALTYLQIPVTDRKVPTLSDVQMAINWIDKNLKENKKIFIHCNLGRGRGPMMACLYLISKGADVNNAIRSIKKSRRYAYFNKNQIQFLHDFSSLLN